ncbi:hypothetical protein Scep_021377 [Stephania cephalantha]|uniref:Protein kinase domain-containing protein n=1 Tax=Stephania cephalantha TaxID=152367 RepID=A0AAP0HWT3_9MAGN
MIVYSVQARHGSVFMGVLEDSSVVTIKSLKVESKKSKSQPTRIPQWCGSYHKDVKSNNILLNETLSAKITDYALSGLVPTLGTLGYLDPEYAVDSQLTDKSDVKWSARLNSGRKKLRKNLSFLQFDQPPFDLPPDTYDTQLKEIFPKVRLVEFSSHRTGVVRLLTSNSRANWISLDYDHDDMALKRLMVCRRTNRVRLVTWR